MSTIRVRDLSARAALRLGRTYQINALAPYPARAPLDLWAFTRRGFVHGAADLGAGFGFGGDSNLLRRLKTGLAAEGIDAATIDALTERDAATVAAAGRASAAAIARLPAAVRAIAPKTPSAPKYQNWFFERRSAQRARAELELASTAANYEDTGLGDIASISLSNAIGPADLSQSASIPPPIVITHISVNAHTQDAGSLADFYEFSLTPPGLRLNAFGTAGALALLDPLTNGGSFSHACRVLVLNQSTHLYGRVVAAAGGGPLALSAAVSYNRLRRKGG